MQEIDDMHDEAEAAFEAGDYLTNDGASPFAYLLYVCPLCLVLCRKMHGTQPAPYIFLLFAFHFRAKYYIFVSEFTARTVC